MRIESSRRRGVLRRLTTLVFFAGLASCVACFGCSLERHGSCDHGSTSPEAALRGLLSAAAAHDGSGAQDFLFDGFSVDGSLLAKLGDSMAGISREPVITTDDQMGSTYTLGAINPDTGDKIGSFFVYDDSNSPGCYGVAWGVPPADDGETPMESIPATAP